MVRYAFIEQLYRHLPHLVDHLSDARYGRFQKIKIQVIVERYQRNVIGDTQSCFSYGFYYPHPYVVAQRENGCGPFFPVEQQLCL